MDVFIILFVLLNYPKSRVDGGGGRNSFDNEAKKGIKLCQNKVVVEKFLTLL
jgi:hypothetical protein